MIIELISVFLVYLGGFILIYSLGIRGYFSFSLGFIVGLSMQVVVGGMQIITILPPTPVLTLSLMIILPAFWLFNKKNTYSINRDSISAFCSSVSIIFAIVTMSVIPFFYEGWFVWTYDSLRYILSGEIIYTNRIELLSEDLLTKRMFSVPIINMPAVISGAGYLRAVFPLLGVSIVTTVMYIIKKSLEGLLSKNRVLILMITGGLLLISNNRFIWHSFYINGHLFCAALTMLISAFGWLILFDKPQYSKSLFPLILIAIPALVFTRPESVIIASILLVPMIGSAGFTLKQKGALLVSLGASTVTFYGFATWWLDGSIFSSYVLYLLYGIVILLIAIILKFLYEFRFFKLLLNHAVLITEVVIWVALLLFSIRTSFIMTRSLNATYANLFLGAGLWGYSVVVLAVITILVLVFIKKPASMTLLRLPVTTFVPIMFILAFISGGDGYRIGPGDSFNRMLIQIVPLTVIYIILSIGFGKPRFARRKDNES